MRSILRIIDVIILLAAISLAVLYFKREYPTEFESMFELEQDRPVPTMGIDQ